VWRETEKGDEARAKAAAASPNFHFAGVLSSWLLHQMRLGFSASDLVNAWVPRILLRLRRLIPSHSRLPRLRSSWIVLKIGNRARHRRPTGPASSSCRRPRTTPPRNGSPFDRLIDGSYGFVHSSSRSMMSVIAWPYRVARTRYDSASGSARLPFRALMPVRPPAAALLCATHPDLGQVDDARAADTAPPHPRQELRAASNESFANFSSRPGLASRRRFERRRAVRPPAYSQPQTQPKCSHRHLLRRSPS